MACTNCTKNKVQRIAEGFTNLVFKDDAVEEIAIARELLCSPCEQLKKLITVGTINKGICRKCNCVTAAKTRSTEETCPIGKW